MTKQFSDLPEVEQQLSHELHDIINEALGRCHELMTSKLDEIAFSRQLEHLHAEIFATLQALLQTAFKYVPTPVLLWQRDRMIEELQKLEKQWLAKNLKNLNS